MADVQKIRVVAEGCASSFAAASVDFVMACKKHNLSADERIYALASGLVAMAETWQFTTFSKEMPARERGIVVTCLLLAILDAYSTMISRLDENGSAETRAALRQAMDKIGDTMKRGENDRTS